MLLDDDVRVQSWADTHIRRRECDLESRLEEDCFGGEIIENETDRAGNLTQKKILLDSLS